MFDYVDKLQFALRCVNSGWYHTVPSTFRHWTWPRSFSKECSKKL